MAINYLASLDLNQNELIHARIENQPNDTAAGTGVAGQIYFNTSADTLKVYTGSAWAQILMGTKVDSLSAATGTFVSFTAASTATGAVDLGTFDLSASGSPGSGNFLRGDNAWATPDYYTDSDVDTHLNTSTATAAQILSWTGTDYDWIDQTTGDITGVTAGTYLSGGGTSGTVTLNHDATNRTDTTSSGSPSAGGTFTAVDSVSTNSTGHITAINVKTVTLPTDGLGVESVTSGSASTITIGGTAADPTVSANTASVANNSANLATGDQIYDFTTGLNVSTFTNDSGYITGNQTITLSGDVTGSGTTSITTTIAAGSVDFAMLAGAAVVTSGEGIGSNDNDTTVPTSAAVKAYTDSVNTGQLVYQGAYDASAAPPTGTSIKKGFTYTVTVAGNGNGFFSIPLEIGDLIIAEQDNPTTEAHWTEVNKNVDVATASTIGIGNVAAGNGIDVSYSNGTATVDAEDSSATNKGAVIVAGGTGITVAYNSGTATVTAESRSSTGTITAGGTSGSVTHSFGLNTMVQTIDASTGDTVFCDVTRTSTSVTASINSAHANNITILVQKIG